MQEFLRNSNPTSWRVLLAVKIMCNYSEEQNKFLTQENGEPVLRALLRERMYILAFLTAFTCFRPQRAKPHTQFPLRMIAYHACWFPQSYFGEQACFHSPVGYFFFYFFTPPSSNISSFCLYAISYNSEISDPDCCVWPRNFICCVFSQGRWRFRWIIKMLQ